jgi:hypothetical protein
MTSELERRMTEGVAKKSNALQPRQARAATLKSRSLSAWSVGEWERRRQRH